MVLETQQRLSGAQGSQPDSYHGLRTRLLTTSALRPGEREQARRFESGDAPRHRAVDFPPTWALQKGEAQLNRATFPQMAFGARKPGNQSGRIRQEGPDQLNGSVEDALENDLIRLLQPSQSGSPAIASGSHRLLRGSLPRRASGCVLAGSWEARQLGGSERIEASLRMTCSNSSSLWSQKAR